ncbi:MAG: ATP-binding protein [Anaerolineae bacterium]|jgi:PAS domain S-box-containing protein
MTQRQRSILSIFAALITLVVLIWLTDAAPAARDDLLPAVFFGILIVFTNTFGVPLAGGRVSLLPMTTVAGFLLVGLVPVMWAAFLGALLHGWIRYHWAEQLEEQLDPGFLAAVGLAAANAALHAVSILVAGLVFLGAGGVTPLTKVDSSNFLPLLLLGLAYVTVNLFIAGLYFAGRGLKALQHYLRSLPNVLLYEGWPLIFAPFVALTYTRLGLGQFVLMALALVATSLVTRSLSLARQRLERRVDELDSLQAVGQALSTSLDLDTILVAIHIQVAKLMPARNFYVALYDPEIDEVSFPLAYENGERVNWRSRRTGNGLTEYVLRTRAPLLIRKEYDATLEALAIDKIGRPATSWLGVPIVARDTSLGVIAVQSYSPHQLYDVSHQEVLITIAAQAAVAIQNARLYARTDQALARRIQELSSILRTTREGILLLDPEDRVLAANRALADFLGVAQLELADTTLHAPRPDGEPPLITLLGYTPQDLRADRQLLVEGKIESKKRRTVISGPPERHVEHNLTPVRDQEGKISGWLLVFRDLTEERELTRLRQDMTSMLIHDLRSPLSVLVSGLELIKLDLAEGRMDSLADALALAEQSSKYVLRLVNDLLDISRLESGQVSVAAEAVEVRPLLEKVAARLRPLAASTDIALEVSTEPSLPPLHVDRRLMDRVLHNLVDNAIKFTPDGGRVRLWGRSDPELAPEVIQVGVTDTGRGIPSEVQSRLFEKFQAVSLAPGHRKGIGLGLPFCQLAVEAHGGEIWVESDGVPGKGSTFVMRLPVAEEDGKSPSADGDASPLLCAS